jgi:hypothetical protein
MLSPADTVSTGLMFIALFSNHSLARELGVIMQSLPNRNRELTFTRLRLQLEQPVRDFLTPVKGMVP